MRPSSSPTRRVQPAVHELETREVPAAPTATEQVFLERLNDARANPVAYGQAVGVDLSYIAASAPLAFDTRLIDATRGHALDMQTNGFFSHTGSDGSSPWARMSAVGYVQTGAGESIAAGFGSSESALSALIVDTGVPSLGHRHHLLAYGSAASHREVGVGIVTGGGPYGTYYTIDSGSTADSRPNLTGVVYRDTNANGKYDAGEGLSGVSVSVAGVGSITAWDTGGYSYKLNPGTYTVTFSGGSLPSPVTRTVTVGSANYRLNVNPAAGPDITGPRVTGATYSDLAARQLTTARLTFSEPIDPDSFAPIDVSVTGPAGAAAVTGVTPVAGTGNTQFDVAFAPQTALGTYTLVVGPDVRDTAGNRMDQNQNGTNGEPSADRYTGTAAISEPGTAAYVGANTTTQGSWRGTFGAEGYTLAQGASSLPAYATMTVAGNQNWTWAASTADIRGLQKPAPATDRLAGTWYSNTTFTVNLYLAAGQHRVSLYMVDWENAGRAQRIEVLDAATGAVLDTRDVSGFSGGRYLSWDLSGAVQFRLTRTGGNNAVVSGVFFGEVPTTPPSPPTTPPAGSAAYVGTDATTQGSWRSAYGADGYSLSQGAASLPAYATVSIGGNQSWTWAASTADIRGLQKPAPATDRLAGTWYSATTFTTDVDLTGGTAKRVSLYVLDWENAGRAMTVEVLDRATGAVLDTRSVSAFSSGKYLSWDLAGAVQFRFTRTGGNNAVLSGIFFGAAPPAPPTPPAGSVTFIGANTTTQGSWRGTFGAEGYTLAQGASSLPAYATMTVAGNQSWTWAASTADIRGLQKPAPATDRLAGTWYSPTDFSVNVDITGTTARRVSLYFVDWDTTSRGMAVEVIDRATGALLDTHNVLDFNGGQYLTWEVTGAVQIRVTNNAGVNAVLSGVFFG